MVQFILTSIGVFLITILLLVVILLVAKSYLSPSGNVNIEINGDKTISVGQGSSLMTTLNENGIFLPSACGGKASCGQCKVQVLEGGGEILDSERPHFTRKEIKDHWRLGCQCKVKGDLKIKVPESVLGVKEWECTVISNKNVSSFIKEFIVALPPGEHMDFIPGSYAQIKIPAYECIDYDKDFDKNDIGPDYLPSWERFNIFSLKAHNPEDTIRAYSMANYPAEGDRITLTVRIATTPFKPKPEVGFQDVPTGIASSYIFSRKPGDKVIMSGPYGDFHPIFNSKKEMIWVGGGAGMAPLRAQIMHMTKTLNTRDRKMHFFYGARALVEAFFVEDFLELEKEFPNFHFHLALDRPDPAADAAGVKYTPGFVHQVMYETYLKDHEAPEDIEYYMCGPGPMSKAVQGRSANMAAIRSKNTKPELLVRKWLWKRGFRYRLCSPRLPGHPDLVLRKYRTCIFVNGCFWHGHDNCRFFRLPKTNRQFWEEKIQRNRVRDKAEQQQLASMGWHCITVWECQLKPQVREATLSSLEYTLNSIFLNDRKIVRYDTPDNENVMDMAAEP